MFDIDHKEVRTEVETYLDHYCIGDKEAKAITEVLNICKVYGYGNIIGWCQTEWAVHLKRAGLEPEIAVKHACSRSPCLTVDFYRKADK